MHSIVSDLESYELNKLDEEYKKDIIRESEI